MTLVNIDPHVILHQKMHVSSTGIFVGKSIGLPAPCGSFSVERIENFDSRARFH